MEKKKQQFPTIKTKVDNCHKINLFKDIKVNLSIVNT